MTKSLFCERGHFIGSLGFLALLTVLAGNAKAARVLPFKLVQNKPVVSVCIQRECGYFLVDFGASGGPELYLRRQFLSKLTNARALNKADSATNMAGQRLTNPLFEVNGLILAGMRFNNVIVGAWKPWGVTLTGESHKAAAPTLDGVIGLDIFMKFGTVALDYTHRRFILGAPPKRTHLVWHSFTLDDNGISMTVEADGHAYRFVLDTGANRSVMQHTHLVKGTQLQSCGPQNNPTINCSLYTPKSFQFGGINSIKPTFLVTSYKQPDYDGIIGGDILHRIYLLLDFKNDTFSIRRSSAK